VAEYGYLDIEDRTPSVGEQIYIPQHAGGRDKELGIFDSSSNDPEGRCNILSTSHRNCGRGATFQDLSYRCDTEGGSSGSPVISKNTGKVVGLHHCGGGCWGNLGVPMTQIYGAIYDQVYPDTDTPTDALTTIAPTEPLTTLPPTTSAPTSPATDVPTESPTASNAPTTKSPTSPPTTTAPTTKTPTSPPTTTAPTSPPSSSQSPTTAPMCQDSSSWGYQKGRKWRGCDFVSGNPTKRCGIKDLNGVSAEDACQCSCSPPATDTPVSGPTAPPAPSGNGSCVDDSTWSFKNGKGCAFLSSKPSKLCEKTDSDGVSGFDACQCSCSAPPQGPSSSPLPPPTTSPGGNTCEDSSSWVYLQGKKARGCDFVSRNPRKRCYRTGTDGRRGYNACQCSCPQ